MATVAIQRRWSGANSAGTAWALVFDAVVSEEHEGETEITDQPVEVGVAIADHAIDKPERLNISAGVSDVPRPEGTVDSFASQSATRSQEAFARLTQLRKAHEPFDVQTGLKLYRNMVCTRIRASQDKDTGAVLFFQAELREIFFVTTQAVIYPAKPATKTARQVAPKKEDGKKDPEVPTKEQRASLLYKLLNGGFGF